ncbi:hypothetical protein CCACVL1_21494 [Corchorus capsularis]|uniref:Uncharacterized protein n=1 Tax=Corchorus capsularis TaxID=210143 RepID=A0A1R3H5E0_COCAP|nr:hypothetical protein CCACVL1_21494 [Corchorus capsularis]
MIYALKKKSAGRKRKRNDDVVMEEKLVATLGDIKSAMKTVGETLKVIVDFLEKEREIEERRKNFFAEILKFEGLSMEEKFRAGLSIIKDKSKIDFFISLPDQEFKRIYIMDHLEAVPKPEN